MARLAFRDKPRIIVVGADGLLGAAVCHRLAEGAQRLRELPTSALEVDRLSDVIYPIEEFRPDWIVNCAGYIDVDAAEKDSEIAYGINGQGAGIIGVAANSCDAHLVHLSTDYVFDGDADVPYRPHDTPNPVNEYGRSKMEGERLVLRVYPPACILRVSWPYGPHKPTAIDEQIKAAQAGEPGPPAFTDDAGSPCYTVTMANRVYDILERALSGIFHCAPKNHCTRWQQAKFVRKYFGHQDDPTEDKLERMNWPAKRPKFSALDGTALDRVLGLQPSTWQTDLTTYIQNFYEKKHDFS